MASDTYTPENDLSLQQSLLSTLNFETLTANTSATGGTLDLIGGTATPNTDSAQATGTGADNIFITTGRYTVRKAEAESTGGTTSLSGSSTLKTTTTSATALGGQSNLQDTGLDTVSASANGSGAANLQLERPPLPTTTAEATGTGGESTFDILGNRNQVTVLI